MTHDPRLHHHRIGTGPMDPADPAARGRPQEGLADVLDRVLDKGLVIAGDISIRLVDVELLTIKVRLLLASADKAREMGIDWWRHDPHLSSAGTGIQHRPVQKETEGTSDAAQLEEENRLLREELRRLENRLTALNHEGTEEGGRSARRYG
jgi:hypothetical protein